jgi:hypothetical protein
MMKNKSNHFVTKAAISLLTAILITSACIPLVSACHTPGIDLIKKGPVFGYAGHNITYTYIVDNTGDVPLSEVSVSDDQCGCATYVSGDDNENGKLDVDETWIFNCTYIPSFTFPNPLKNNATAYGQWNCNHVNDSDEYTLYPFILRKNVLLYWEGDSISYDDPETEFVIELWKGEDHLDTFTISESSTQKLWLSAGTYQFCEVDLPTGYQSAYGCITFTAGEQYPDWTHINVITFDLSIIKTGPECVYQGDNATYYYTVTNQGPASVTPVVHDDICGIPTFTGGDCNENGKIDPNETWTYKCNYTVIEDCEQLLNNTVNVTDEEGAGISPDEWWLGGDRNLDNNTDSHSVYVVCRQEEPDEPEEPEEPDEPDYPDEPENPDEPDEPEEPKEPKGQPQPPTVFVATSGGKKPHADANGPYEGDVDQEIAFDGSGSYDTSGTIIYFGWAFGDGTTGVGETVRHVYTHGGTYVVELTVQNDKGMWDTDTTQAHVVIPNRPPELLVISGPSCETNTKYSYVFGAYDPDSDNISYTIDWGDGTTEETGFLPSGYLFSMLHSWENPGDYNITIIASDSEYTAQASMIVHMEDNIADNIAIVLLGILALIALMLALMYSRKKKQK